MLQHIITFLYHVDDPDNKPNLDMASFDFSVLVDLFETAEYLGMDDLKSKVILDGLMNKQEFLKYTNVRRHYFDNL